MAARRCQGEPRAAAGLRRSGSASAPGAARSVAAASVNRYSPVAGHVALRQAAAGYWARRGLATGPGQVVRGPGSKPLLFALLLAIGGAVALPRPSWVSYAAQAAMIGARAHLVPAAPGEGGICDPADPVGAGDPAGQPHRPTGVPGHRRRAVRGRGRPRADHHLRRDLPRPGARPGHAAAEPGPGGTGPDGHHHRAEQEPGAGRLADRRARMPPSPLGHRLRRSLLGVGSEIWSAPAAPVQHAALAFAEPPLIAARVAASPALRAATAGLAVALPQGGFYIYPTSSPCASTWLAGTRSPPPLAWQSCCCIATAPPRSPAPRSASPGRPAAAAGHRHAVRRQRPAAAGNGAYRPRPHGAPVDHRRAGPAPRDTRRPGQPSPNRGRCLDKLRRHPAIAALINAGQARCK
jgi:aspartate aminotransferase